ncbi:MAG: MobA/MobL family protein [Proteobacteria bacterium]|nr:MobA/MobL family protein [Pseudomonadota bacterium]
MALFYLQISSVGRGAGRSATQAAAYRAGERVRDERTGQLYNFTRRRDVLHTEIMVPERFAAQPLEWARSRERLWNTAEHAEKRHNSLVAREFQVVLPFELQAPQRLALARAFTREITERYGVVADLSIHEPRAGGDPRNFHAHILTTTRAVAPAGLGAKSGLDMRPLERRRHGLPDHRQEYVNVRERWAQMTNDALREAGIEARVDHRSLAAQGIDREPQPRIPIAHLKMESRGERSELAERLRAQYRERAERRRERSQGARVAAAGEASHGRGEHGAQAGVDLAEVRRQARTAWLALREAARAPQEQARTHEMSGEPQVPENDLSG